MRTSNSNFQSKEVDCSTTAFDLNDILFQIQPNTVKIPRQESDLTWIYSKVHGSVPFFLYAEEILLSTSTQPYLYPTKKKHAKNQERNMNEGKLIKNESSWRCWGDLGQVPCFRANISIKKSIGLSFQMALSQHLVTTIIRPRIVY